ncbi:hypothetical protein D0C36_15475 [Mucilaginibacter conchicola]|uniref:Tetratricopeptide repeat protein n=1 Tax=Mucilaginibacter conchicola TaxID=2303333 RepID=A0A372NUA9_9SPHI|nr:hypothetical protein [Mucilaginibacter conchicola]RFZ92795.1 hypothetical protein D0C36_15475 [Mucilaginibacter conchicola]
MKTWTRSLIYLISFSVCFFGEVVINLACGPEPDPYDYYVSFFHNDLSQSNGFRPFTFTNYSFLYSDEEPVNEQDINAAEWAAYLGHNTTTAHVKQAMYKLNGKTDTLLNNGFLISGSRLPDSLRGNSFLKNLPTNKSAYKYYGFTKRIEPLVNYATDYWDPKPIDTPALKRSAGEALSLAATTGDKFTRLRYYYQAQRLLHYSAQYKQAAKVYDKHIAGEVSGSRIKAWALALRAGEERRIGDTVKAAYLFSKVFALYPERRVQAYRNYRAIDVPKAAILTIAKTNEEKATIYAIESFGNPKPDVEAIKNIYDIQPTSPLITTLITREMNKQEEYYLSRVLNDPQTPIMNSFYGIDWAGSEKNATAQVNQLDNLCNRIASEHKNPDHAIGYLASAYLAWMQKNTSKGLDEISLLNNVKLTEKLDGQKQIIKLLLASQGMQAKNKMDEAVLLPSLKWLDSKVKAETRDFYKKHSGANYYYYGETDERRFAVTARNFYHSVLAPMYLKQKDTAMAALAMVTGDIPGNKPDLSYETIDFLQNFIHSKAFVKLIQWRTKAPTMPYLKFMSQKIAAAKPAWLYELLGTAYLREHQYEKAISAYSHTTKAAINQGDEASNPFISQLADYPKIYQDGSRRSYNKLEFAKAMAKLQRQIAQKPTAAVYFKYATGLYNTAMHGNSWDLISYNWTANDFGRNKYYYDVDYIRSANAEVYYLKARALSKDPEFKARCTFMAAKCRQKQIRIPNYRDSDYETADLNYSRLVRQNAYFKQLGDGYKGTAFFKRAVNECSYLQDFLKGRIKRSKR